MDITITEIMALTTNLVTNPATNPVTNLAIMEVTIPKIMVMVTALALR